MIGLKGWRNAGNQSAHCSVAGESCMYSTPPTPTWPPGNIYERLNILLELTAPYVKVGGRVLAMKGMAAKEELAEAKNAIAKLGLKLEEVREFPIDGTNHAVIVLRKVAPTPKQYPRRFAKIKQAPL